MALPFDTNIAYLLGIWQHSSDQTKLSAEGDTVDAFVDTILKLGVVEPNKIKVEEDHAFMFHSQLRNALKKFSKSREFRLRFANEYSASYFAGWYDSNSAIKEGFIKLFRGDKIDEFILTQLNFNPTLRGKVLVLEKPLPFLRFIRDYSKVYKEEIDEILKSSKIEQ